MTKASLLVVAGALASAIGDDFDMLPKDKPMLPQTLPLATQPTVEGRLPSLNQATAWLNSRPLAAADLRGKVVLVDFWTYSCINWRRQLPYLRAWADKYKDQGLVVIGVHTPEFDFEKNVDNVRKASLDMRIGYPVAVDSAYGLWEAFGNEYWPALYFIDAQGRVRRSKFGEGEYERSETFIQQLLIEAGARGVSRELTRVEGHGAEAAADWSNLKSPENYLGYDRTVNFVSPGGAALGKPRVYVAPARLTLNEWALVGEWTVGRAAIALQKSNGKLVYRFHARDLHLVMGPASSKSPVRFRLLIDGLPPGTAHGSDVDSQGNGTVNEQRLYQLVRQPGAIVDRQLVLEFLDPAVEAFSFTFG